MFRVKIYPYYYSKASPYEEMPVWYSDLAHGINFETKNPGGFSICSFRLDVPFEIALEMYGQFHAYPVKIESGDGSIAWAGRIEEITAEPGQATITARGMWYSLFDKFYDDGSLIEEPLTENPITNLDTYAMLYGTSQKLAQSFQLSEARSIQDVQINIANFGVSEGHITIALAEDNSGVPGTIITSRDVPVGSIAAVGGSDYIGLPTEARLTGSTTYWITLTPGGDYWSGVGAVTGTDNGSGNDRDYLVDTTKDFFTEGLTIGSWLGNTTDGCVGAISSIELYGLTSPATELYWVQEDVPSFTSMTTAKDNNPATEYTLSSYSTDDDWIGVCHSAGYGGIEVEVGNTPNATPGDLKVYYANDTEWSELTVLVNSTITDDGVPLGQDGYIQWAIPYTWPVDDVNSVSGYWVKLVLSDASSSFTIQDIFVGSNSRVEFEDLTGGTDNDFDNGDSYEYYRAVGLGVDSSASYTSGVLKYYNDGSWSTHSRDGIFYIWCYPRYYYSSGADTSAGDIIESIISGSEFIRLGGIDDTGNAAVNPIRFNQGEKEGDVIEKLVSFGSSDSDPLPMAFLIYEDNFATFRKMEDGTTWYVDVSNVPIGQQALNVTSSLSDLIAKIAVIYSDEVGSRAITPWVENDDLYNRFGYRREGVLSIGGATQVVAEELSTLVASIYATPGQRSELLIDGSVQTVSGSSWPAWYVRAGDIIKFRNLIPQSAVVSNEVVDRISTVYVNETKYDAENGRLTVVPSNRTNDILDILLTLAGLGGGSVN